jgi:cell division septation protein DedD
MPWGLLIMSIKCRSVKLQLNLKSILLLIFIFSLFSLPTNQAFAGVKFKEVQLIEDDLLLLDVKLNNDYVASSVDAFPYQDRILIAIEPLFESLNLKYQLHTDQLIVWKDDIKYTLPLSKLVTGDFLKQVESTLTESLWANDGFYFFMDDQTLANFFGVSIEVNKFQLRILIKTEQYLFPIQKIEILRQQRILATSAEVRETKEKIAPVITIADQYRLLTLPHGRISASLDLKDSDLNNLISVQLSSDLLYHSADFTIGKVNNNKLSTRLRLSRFKTKPDDYILGAFDKYSFGDVSGYSNNLTTRVNSGLGAQLDRTPENFRRRNLAITIEETAPPGWEAELFHNNRFITVTTVPDNGLLVFDDVLTEYGNNYYQIKLYGPHGETEVIEKYVDLSKNALSKGAMAYNLYALDRNHRLIDDNNDAERALTDFGGTFDYGMSDSWQLGVGIANISDTIDDNQQLFSIKNSLSFPGFLVENDLSFNQNLGYAQLTSITGNIFDKERFTLAYESADDYESARLKAKGSHVDIINATISGSLATWSYGFSSLYRTKENNSNWYIRNNLSRSFGQIYFTHTFNYSNFETELLNSADQTTTNENIIIKSETLQGSINLSGRLLDNFRLSSNIVYDPKADDPIIDSSTMTLEWSPKLYGISNYFAARYRPLSEGNNNWQLSYRTTWNADEFELNLGALYNADESWNFNLGFRFFLGYDYHNKRVLFRNKISSQTATIAAHSYLDRQANGIPDPLDYNLPEVEFIGNPEWEGIKSGKEGRTILPGTPTGGEFRFDAKWKDGANTVNNNYVVYTHPGAYIDVNMPFNLTTEVTGFVQIAGNALPLKQVIIELRSQDGAVITTKTDIDGYYEFINLRPDQYQLSISKKYLRYKGLTADIIGYRFTSPKSGGFIELTTLELKRSSSATDIDTETIDDFKLTEDNSAAIIWDDEEKNRREYFNLPPKEKAATKYSITPEEKSVEEILEKNIISKSNMSEASISTSSTKSNNAIIINAIESKQSLLPSITFANKPLTKSDVVKVEIKSVENVSIVRAAVKPEKIASNSSYTLQLGVFSAKANANKLASKFITLSQAAYVTESMINNTPVYKVLLGNFTNKEQALNFAKQNLTTNQNYYLKKATNKSDSSNNQGTLISNQAKSGWVIQYYAGGSRNFQTNAAQNISVKSLFTASKESPDKGVLYCLISEVFSSKKAAILAKNKVNIEGWVTSSATFTNIAKWN